jgi:hypothetical protein
VFSTQLNSTYKQAEYPDRLRLYRKLFTSLDNFHISDKKNSPVLGKSTVMVVCLRERSRCRRKRPRLQADRLTTAD